jgi:hypothetical protein
MESTDLRDGHHALRARVDAPRVLTLTLALAVRPFQVNPPTQALNTMGG